MWPDTFGLACCAIEMMSIVTSRYDIARFGMEPFRGSPRQADLLIVSGRVSHKMAAPLRQIYDQMLEPKWVIAMGACASSGGMFNNYAIVQSVDKIVPVDMYVPGCPPRPEQLIEGIVRLHEAVQGRRAARVRAAERRVVSDWNAVPGLRRGQSDAARRDDGRRRARRSWSTRRRYLRDEPASTSSPTSPRSTTSAGASEGVSGYIGTPAGRDLNTPMTQGYQVVPLAEAEALRDELPPARDRPERPRARPAADVARRGRGGADASSASGRPPTCTSARPTT